MECVLCDWLISRSLRPSRFIHPVAPVRMPFLLKPSDIPVCGWTTLRLAHPSADTGLSCAERCCPVVSPRAGSVCMSVLGASSGICQGSGKRVCWKLQSLRPSARSFLALLFPQNCCGVTSCGVPEPVQAHCSLQLRFFVKRGVSLIVDTKAVR